jgi:hypothetical protein
MTTLQRRLDKLERKIVRPAMLVADLSGLTDNELEVLQKLVDDTIQEEQRNPTGKRLLPLRVDRSILTEEESLIYDGMSQSETPCPGYVAVESRQ